MRAYNYRGVENKNVYRTYQICIRLFGHATQPNWQTQNNKKKSNIMQIRHRGNKMQIISQLPLQKPILAVCV